MARVIEKIEARGHPNVRANHKTTFEFTRDNFVTVKGDCILAVGASKAAADLSSSFKRLASSELARIIFIIEVDGIVDLAVGRGSKLLTFTDGRAIVARKSNYVCPKTVMINSNKAARDFTRVFIEHLRDPDAKVNITMIVDS
jgi:hypothetical protein